MRGSLVREAFVSVHHGGPVPLRVLAVLLAAVTAVSAASIAAEPVQPRQPAADLQARIKATAVKVIPAVVTIASTVVVREPTYLEEDMPFGLFREPLPRRQYGQGSGVIVTADGYIITNNHVIAEAEEVVVLLADRRQFQGRVVATDPKTDVAVVKIAAQGLPTIPWGDSSDLSVGDFVLAIGNPMGLGQTVTFGIVSAIGRADVGVTDYEDFIQTDAPINPGNSGGALVSINGSLVGINTAIASMTGGSVGVGFAIPSNMVRTTLQSLMKTGRVVRGFLGASTQDVTPLLGKLFKLPDVNGAIITDVMPGSAADKAGLRRGDVIVQFDGKDVPDAGHLRNMIANAPIGSAHRIQTIRDGRREMRELTVQEAPKERARRSPASETTVEPAAHPLGGMLVDDLSFQIARRLGMRARSGVVVADVEPGSLADAAGILPGDVVLEVNRQPVGNLATYQQVVNGIKPRQAVLLLVNRRGAMLYMGIEGA